MKKNSILSLTSGISDRVCKMTLPVFLFLATALHGALRTNDVFNYTVGATLISQSGWSYAGSSSDSPTIVTNSLSYSGLSASLGNHISVKQGVMANDASTAQIAYETGAEYPTNTALYASYIFKVTDIASLTTNNTKELTAFRVSNDNCLMLRRNGSDSSRFDIGIGYDNSSARMVWHTNGGSGYQTNQNIFVVMGTTNSSIQSTSTGFSLWINPDISSGLGTPSVTAGWRNVLANLRNFYVLAQGTTSGSTGAKVEIDELRIGTTTADVMPQAQLYPLVSAASVAVPEGGTNTFQVKLTVQPSATATVSVSRASGDTDLTVNGGDSLIFTVNDWDTWQTVTLAAGADADAQNGSATIHCIGAGMADTGVVSAVESDDDTLNITTSLTDVTVPEGGSAEFGVKLTADPVSAVTVSVARVSGDTDISVQSGSSLVFNSGNWNDYQTVTLAAGQDGDYLDSTAAINCSASGLSTVQVTATEDDDELPLNVVVSAPYIAVPEGGTNAFSVSLSQQPDSNVTVYISRWWGDSDISLVAGASVTLNFTTNDWDQPQTVFVKAIEDPKNLDERDTVPAVFPCTIGQKTYSDPETYQQETIVYVKHIDNDISPHEVTLRFDFGTTATATGHWNVVTNWMTGLALTDASDSTGNSRGIGVRVVQPFSGLEQGGMDVDGCYPSNVMADGFFVTGTGTIGTATQAIIQVEGLSPYEEYNFVFFGSKKRSYSSPIIGQTVCSIGSAGSTMSTWNQFSLTRYILRQRADSNGVVQVSVKADAGSDYGYLNAMEIYYTPEVVFTRQYSFLRGGDSNSVGVMLSSRPLSNVVVNVGFAAGSDGDLQYNSSSQLIFTPDNWMSNQWVVISAVNDDDPQAGSGQLVFSNSLSGAVSHNVYEREDVTFAPGDDVTIEDPARFGVNLKSSIFRAYNPWPTVNKWIAASYFEPYSFRFYGRADTGAGVGGAQSSAPGYQYLENTGTSFNKWGQYPNGFWNGAVIQVYRHNTNSWTLDFVREDTVYRYDTSESRIYLSNTGGAALQTGDEYLLTLSGVTNVPAGYAPVATVRTSSAAYELAGNPPTNGGLTCLKVTVTNSTGGHVYQSLGSYTTAADYDERDNLNYLVGETYELSVWLRRETSGTVEVKFDNYEATGTTITVGTVWTNYVRQISITALPSTEPKQKLALSAPGVLYVDNWTIRQVTTNGVSAPDYKLNDWQPQVKEMLEKFNVQAIRYWGFWSEDFTVQDMLRPVWEQPSQDGSFDNFPSLHEMLTRYHEVGADPWIILRCLSTTNELSALMDYLAGTDPANEWVALRQAQGQQEPWSDVFHKIRLEMGNETWNYFFWPNWSETAYKYADVVNHGFGKIRAHSGFDTNKFILIANGHGAGLGIEPKIGDPGYGGFSTKVALLCTGTVNVVDGGLYIGGWDGLTMVGQNDTEFWREQLWYSTRICEPRVEEHMQWADRWGYKFSVYESGVGYPLPGPGDPYNEGAEKSGKTLGSAVAMADYFLYGMGSGFQDINFFQFKPGRGWASHHDYINNYPYCVWHVMSLRNEYCRGSLVSVGQTGGTIIDIPDIIAYEQDNDGNFAAKALDGRTNIPMELCYTFREDLTNTARYSFMFLSRHVEDESQITLDLPYVPESGYTIYRMEAAPGTEWAPSIGNRESNTVQIVEIQTNGFHDGFTFTMRPHDIVVLVNYADPDYWTVPAPPSGLQVYESWTEQGTGTVVLVWTDASTNENGFVIERSLSGSNAYAQITAEPADGTSFTDTGLQEGTAYDYRICARNAAGQSEYVYLTNVVTALDGIVLLQPTADTWVNSSASGSNYGTDNTLDVKNLSTDIRRAYFRFNVAGIPSAVVGCDLYLYKSAATAMITNSFLLHEIADNTWGENTVTWNNPPSGLGSLLNTVVIPTNSSTWINMDAPALLEAVTNAVADDGLISLQLASDSTSIASVRSREYSGKEPYLKIRYAGSTDGKPYISTRALTGASVGMTYSQPLQAVGGTTPYAWTLYSGSLPSGLGLSSSGSITGTPVSVGSAEFVVQVTDNASAQALRTLSLTATNPPLTIVASTSAIEVPEGSSNVFSVKLNIQPVTETTVTVSRVSGDSDIAVSGGASLIFSAGNWSSWQTITLSSAQDVDKADGVAVITCSADGVQPVTLSASEADDDNSQVETVTTSFQDGVSGYTGTADAYLSSFSTNSNFGAAAYIRIRDTYYNSLIKWDLSAVPTNASVQSVRLIFNCYDEAPANLNIYELSRSWIESSATWGGYDGTNVWQIAGGEGSNDRGTNVLGTCDITSVGVKQVSLNDNGVALVQSWVQNTADNRGFILKSDESQLAAMYSSEDSVASNRPVIEITYAFPELVTTTSGLSVPEGSTNVFGVKLAMQPTVSTTVTVSRVSGDSDIAVSGGSTLVFGPLDWNICQYVTLSAAEDVDVAGGVAQIGCTAAGMSNVTLTATESDNDTLGIAVSTNAVSVAEGSVNAFTVKLTAQPSEDTTVTVSRVSGDSDITVSGGASLVFNATDWDSWQQVTLSAADDVDVADGSAVIRCSSVGITAVDVAAAEDDDDTLSLTVSTNAVTVAEGSVSTVDVKLTAQPSEDTTVTVSRVSGDSDITVSGGASLVFNATDWDSWQQVTLSAADDVDVADGSAVIRCSSVGITAVDVAAAEDDDDTLSLTVSTNAVTVAEGSVSTVDVKLTAQPSEDTTVTVSRVSGDSDITVSGGASLVFNATDWDSWQQVTLSAADDVDVADGSAVIRCSSVGITAVDVAAAEDDDDTLSLTVSTNAVAVSEGSTNIFTVKLTAQPSEDTTVTVSRVSGDTDITVMAGVSLVFNSGSWSNWQAVTLSASNDSDIANGTATVQCVAASVTSLVTVVEVDDDTEVTVSFQDGISGYAGTVDTYLSSSSTNSSYGAITYMRMRDAIYNSLIKWSLSAIPTNASVQSVRLVLNCYDEASANLNVYEIKRNWIENSASWGRYDGTNVWQTAGGEGVNDRGTNVLGTCALNGIGIKQISLNTTGVALVQSWVSDPSANLGFVLKADANALAAIHSSENTTATNRPLIEITYIAPGSGGKSMSMSAAPSVDELRAALVSTPVPLDAPVITLTKAVKAGSNLIGVSLEAETLGAMLGSQLLAGDRVILYNAEKAAYETYSADAAAELVIPAGGAFWLETEKARDLVLTGREVSSKQILLFEGLQVIASPVAKGSLLQDIVGGTGNANPGLCDKVSVLTNGVYQVYGLGADGIWYKADDKKVWSRKIKTDEVIEAGEGFWYDAKKPFIWSVE